MPSPDSQPELRSLTIKPPILGWNTRDALSDMDPAYAIEIENYFPNNGSIDLRNGTRIALTGLAGRAVAIGNLRYNVLDFMLISTVTPGIYSSVGGAVTSIIGAATPTLFFQFFQQFKDRVFMTTNYGLDDVYHWAGTGNIAASAFTGPGGDDKLLGPMTVYKNRIYFAHRSNYTTNGNIIGGLPEIWYGGLNAVTGTLTQFNIESMLQLGGFIQFIGKVTRAKDFTEDELFCIVTSEGEVLLYQGNYPGEISQWGLIARYFIPKPLGSKAFFYLGSTLVIITKQGLYPMDAIMGGNFANSQSSLFGGDLSNIIKSAFTSAINTAAALSGIEDFMYSGINYPKGNYLLINIPTSTTGLTASQFVMNTMTGAWTLFTNQNAWGWGTYKDNLYYLDPTLSTLNGIGMKADIGSYDENPVSAAAKLSRNVKIRPAYNYFGDREGFKQFTFVIPTLYQSNGLDLTIDSNVDYENTAATSPNTDTTKGNDYQIYQPRCGLQGIGKSASIRIDGTVTDKLSSIQALDVFYTEADPA